MGIVIPDQLKSKLPDGSYVYALCANAEKLFGLDAVYFAEYTKHNAEHVTAVLKFIEKLVPSQTLDKLSIHALEVLTASAIVHDLGMFIQRDGLHKLLFGTYKNNKTEHLDKQTWFEAWVEFYTQAQRWDDRKLNQVFSDTVPIEHNLRDKLPEEMSDRHKLLYGEFLRRYHHRLAHDIATHGFFGNEQINIFANCGCDVFTKDLIGLIARSHGMPVRDTLQYLEQKHGEKKRAMPRGIPVLYLMVVLRLADYLHAGQARAPQEREQASRLLSPVSHKEYVWNQAVYDELDFDAAKKEVFVTAEPESSEVYQSLEAWIRAVQQELDLSWAIIAEQYEYKYELTVHRIDTNIFDEKVLAGYNEKYLTRQAMLGANPDIVKHLVAPLYGDDPSYGVRELIQNAVDACNERTVLDGTKGEITVDVNTEMGILTITDNGIGMNEDVLVNYYLVAGSSYRYSPTWTEKFHDEDDKPIIARSGRFGIGALATFLIGETATVTTRHMDDEIGYQFTYELEPKALEVKRVTCEVGTRITITLQKRTKNYFQQYVSDTGATRIDIMHIDWCRWYHYEFPKTNYYLNGVLLKTNISKLPLCEGNGWHRVELTKGVVVFWSADNNNEMPSYRENRETFINGILHPISNDYLRFSLNSIGRIDQLTISFQDPNGYLNMDLSRGKLYHMSEFSLIVEDYYRYLLARLLGCSEAQLLASGKAYERAFEDTTVKQVVCYYHLGYSTLRLIELTSPTLIQRIRALLVRSELSPIEPLEIRQSKSMEAQKKAMNSRIPAILIETISVIVDDNTYYEDGFRSGEQYFHRLGGYVNGTAIFVNSGLVDNSSLHSPYCDNIMRKLLQEYLPREAKTTTEGEFAGEINGGNGGWIPYDMEERKRIYPKAFRELARYMK